MTPSAQLNNFIQLYNNGEADGTRNTAASETPVRWAQQCRFLFLKYFNNKRIDMFRFGLIFLLTFSLEIACGQKGSSFPPGITVDPTIESLCKSKKDLNSFKIVHYINDSVSSQPLVATLGKLPLTPSTAIIKGDTLFTFIGTLLPWGFQIRLTDTIPEVLTFVYSKSCKCFKNDLSKTDLSYQAGAKSNSVTLVLNKLTNINVGDKIYGYIKTKGGDIYHTSGVQGKYDKWNFHYEGFFVAEFQKGD